METKHIYSLPNPNPNPNQILHPFHPLHPLTPANRPRCFQCDACRKHPVDFTFRCEACDFDLDGECALLVPTIKYEGHEEHLLTLFDQIYDDDDHDPCLCNSCNIPCSALVLRCVDCNFNVHKSCAHDKSFVEFPKHIQHIFHPLHRLVLRDHPRKDLCCDACEVEIKNFSFRCEECDFTLGHECTSLAPTIKYEGHHHLLTLFHEFHLRFWCRSCDQGGIGFVFRCVECRFNLHPHCLPSFPRTIQHKCHICPLTLTNSVHEDADTDEYYCDACEEQRKPSRSESVYYCADCSYVAHIKCVISEVLPLLVAEQEKIEQPKPIQHIFHPLHPLFPWVQARNYFKCKACAVEIKNFCFCCEKCDFTLGHECTSLAPTIKYEGHHHLLTLFHEFHVHFWCDSCEAMGHGFVFRCVECDFSLHPHCLPSFPRTIQHKCHETCPLTLTNSVPEDDDTEEYYCDACEKKRNRYESVYCCADCSFVAHIKCVISEVLPLLDAEQEKIVWPKEEKIRHASTVEGLLGAGLGGEVMEKGVSAAMPSETVEVGVTAGQEEVEAEVTEDLVIAKLEGENSKLRAENEALTAKLEALESEHALCVASKGNEALTSELEALTVKLEALETEHALCVASKRLSEGDKCLSEASASE